MAEGCAERFKFSTVLLCVVFCVLFSNTSSASTQVNLRTGPSRSVRSFPGASAVTTRAPQVVVRVHSGLIAAVLIVSTIALLAAVWIIRTYCFPQSNVTYRYSVLRQIEEQRAARDDEDSDEELLE